MKFYDVVDDSGDYPALIYACNKASAALFYRFEVCEGKVQPIKEVDIDDVYARMLEAADHDTEHDYKEFGIMGCLQDIISKRQPTLVLARGIE